MSHDTLSISGLASISALGYGPEQTWQAYQDPGHRLQLRAAGNVEAWMGSCPEPARREVEALRSASPNYQALDESVLMALLAARAAARAAGWQQGKRIGVNIGSSRGATGLFESYHEEFLRTGETAGLSSPTTTLGNIAFWVAQDLGTPGPEFSHSITCSTALHALLNGIAWIRSGMSDRFLVGGSEAPLTPFTLAQMKALRIYSRETGPYPCRALDPAKSNNSMVLGEGAAVACLERGKTGRTMALICGVGYATEPLRHPASLSAEAHCLQASMQMALGSLPPGEVDAVVLHAPGTLKGDRAELLAVESVFGSRPPALTGNKWKIGHTLGASGMLSLEMAVQMLARQQFIGLPFGPSPAPARLHYIMVNAVGFGGNAVSILLERS